MSAPTRLLVRDLAQLATPAGRDAPLRGAALGAVEVLEDAYVLCRGDTIEAVGRMRDLPALDGDVVELDGARPLRDPGPRRLPHARGLRRRPRRGVLAPRGGRVVRGAPRARRRHPLDRPCDARRRRGRPAAGGRAPSRLDARATARRPSRRSRATASTGTPSSPPCARSAPRAGSRPGSARTPCRRSSPTPTRTSTSRSPRCCPRRRRSPRPPTSSSSAARSTPRRRAATSRRAATPASRCACTATSSPSRERSRSRSSSARAPSTISRRRATTGIRALAASPVVGVVLPASALFLGRPMPPARALVDAGAAVALATDFNPGSAFCESLPLCCSLAATQLKLSPAEALAACTVNAAHVLGRADRLGTARARLSRRPRPARRARLALPRVPPRRRRRRRGRRSQGRYASSAMPSRKQKRREAKSKRHEYEFVYLDSEGNELEEPPEELVAPAKAKASSNGSKAAAPKRAAQPARSRGREPQPPSWQRAGKRALILGAVVFVLFAFTQQEGRVHAPRSRSRSSTPCSSSRSRTASTASPTGGTRRAQEARRLQRAAARSAEEALNRPLDLDSRG